MQSIILKSQVFLHNSNSCTTSVIHEKAQTNLSKPTCGAIANDRKYKKTTSHGVVAGGEFMEPDCRAPFIGTNTASFYSSYIVSSVYQYSGELFRLLVSVFLVYYVNVCRYSVC